MIRRHGDDPELTVPRTHGEGGAAIVGNGTSGAAAIRRAVRLGVRFPYFGMPDEPWESRERIKSAPNPQNTAQLLVRTGTGPAQQLTNPNAD